MSESLFTLDFQVRDYECDMEGIVNHAVYLHYLEHARHTYLKSVGLDFAQFVRDGITLVVVRAELDYQHSLRSGDRFRVGVRLERASRLRFAFVQPVTLLPDGQPVVRARIIGTALAEQSRPFLPASFESLLEA